MGWFKKKNKEKEEKNPPDKPQPVKSASRRELVKILDKIWEPYDNDREEFKAEVHYCQHLMNLVYDIYVRRGSRRQKQLLADLFSENQLPRNNKQRSDWVRSVGSMILTEEALKDELELSPMLTFLTKLIWLREMEDRVGKGNLHDQWTEIPAEFDYFQTLLRPHLDHKSAWALKEKCGVEDVWAPRSIRPGLDRHQTALPLTQSAQTTFVVRAFAVLMKDREFQDDVMRSLRN